MRDRVSLDRERHGIRRELDGDLSSRASSIADDPPRHVIDRLGLRPERGPDRSLWDEAAARLDQHATAFDVDVSGRYRHLGRSWGWEDTAIGASARPASQACERLDRSLGRVLAIEPPGLELGLQACKNERAVSFCRPRCERLILVVAPARPFVS